MVASIIFKLADSQPDVQPTGEGHASAGKNGVAWVLRFGGLMALVSRAKHSAGHTKRDSDRRVDFSQGPAYKDRKGLSKVMHAIG